MTPLDAIARHGVDFPLPPPPPARGPIGVYLLISNGSVIYVGATSNIAARVANHAYGANSDQPRKRPKAFDRVVWIALATADVSAYEGALIRALRPPLNRRAPAPCGRDAEILARLGLPGHDEVAAQAAFRTAAYQPRPHTRGPRPYMRRAARARSKRARS